VRGRGTSLTPKNVLRTVDGDSHALSEDVTIRANEGRDLGEGVGGLELLRGLLGVDGDDLEVDVVGLRDGEDGRGARVGLVRIKKNLSATAC